MNPTNGNYVVVWSSQGQNAGGGYDVYFQRYNAAGVAQGPATLVDTPVNGVNQQYANVAMNSSGNFVVTWSSQQWGHWNIYAQQYNASGVAQGLRDPGRYAREPGSGILHGCHQRRRQFRRHLVRPLSPAHGRSMPTSSIPMAFLKLSLSRLPTQARNRCNPMWR